MTRRQVMKLISCAAIFGGGLFGAALAIKNTDTKRTFLRPPGAITEKSFLATCIKCGQCLQVCPYHSVKLFDITDGLSIGTPYINPKNRGCYLCDLLPCVLSCPSGSLNTNVTTAQDVKMGRAKIIDIKKCLAYENKTVSKDDIDKLIYKKAKTDVEIELNAKLLNYEGKLCRICEDFCPYPDRSSAIEFSDYEGKQIPSIKEKCVGCGVCAELCPAKIIDIEVE